MGLVEGSGEGCDGACIGTGVGPDGAAVPVGADDG